MNRGLARCCCSCGSCAIWISESGLIVVLDFSFHAVRYYPTVQTTRGRSAASHEGQLSETHCMATAAERASRPQAPASQPSLPPPPLRTKRHVDIQHNQPTLFLARRLILVLLSQTNITKRSTRAWHRVVSASVCLQGRSFGAPRSWCAGCPARDAGCLARGLEAASQRARSRAS